MNDIPSSRAVSLSAWDQNWLDILSFDPAALKRGIGYIYQLLSLPKPTIHYVDGWRGGILLVLRNHPDQRDYAVNRNSGHNPSLQLKYTDTRFVDSSFTRFLGLLREEITLDWE